MTANNAPGSNCSSGNFNDLVDSIGESRLHIGRFLRSQEGDLEQGSWVCAGLIPRAKK